jgi:hypothetical protein
MTGTEHIIGLDPEKKALLLATDLITLKPVENRGKIRIATVKDNRIILLFYTFNSYKKAYLIQTDSTANRIDLPLSKLRGRLIIESKRKESTSLVKYIAYIKEKNGGSIELPVYIYQKLLLILKTRPFNLAYCDDLLSEYSRTI